MPYSKKGYIPQESGLFVFSIYLVSTLVQLNVAIMNLYLKYYLLKLYGQFYPSADGQGSYFGHKIQPLVNINFNHKRLL